MADSIEKNAIVKARGIKKDVFILGDFVCIKSRPNLFLNWSLPVLLLLLVVIFSPSTKRISYILFAFCFYSVFIYWCINYRNSFTNNMIETIMQIDFKYISRIIFKKPVGNTNGFIEFILDAKKIGVHSFNENTKTEFLVEELNNFENLRIEIEKKINCIYLDSKAEIEKTITSTSSDSKFFPKDNYTELERLFQLKEKGIITEDDYNKKKNQILGI